MPSDTLVVKSTESHKKFYDYLANNISRLSHVEGDSRTVLKELEEVIYMLLLLILSEDEEQDPENKSNVSMLYDTLRVLVQLYKNVLNSGSSKDRSSATLLQHPEVQKLLAAQHTDIPGAQSTEYNALPSGTEDFLGQSGDFFNNLDLNLGAGEDFELTTADVAMREARQQKEVGQDLNSVLNNFLNSSGAKALETKTNSLESGLNPATTQPPITDVDIDFMLSHNIPQQDQHRHNSSFDLFNHRLITDDLAFSDALNHPSPDPSLASSLHHQHEPILGNDLSLHLHDQFFSTNGHNTNEFDDNTLLGNLAPQSHPEPNDAHIPVSSHENYYAQPQQGLSMSPMLNILPNSPLVLPSANANNNQYNFLVDFNGAGSQPAMPGSEAPGSS